MDEATGNWLIYGGLGIGALFGLLVQRYRFCVVAAVSNSLLMRDQRQLLAFLLAWAVAIGGTLALEFTQTVDVAQSAYRNAHLDWFGALFGGLVFGAGATLAGGCAIRTITRAAEGNLNGLLALLVFALFAGITQFGLLAQPRIALSDATSVVLASGDVGLTALLPLPPLLVVIAVCGALLLLAFWAQRSVGGWGLAAVGAVIGALVVAGWYVTGVLAQDAFFPTPPSGVTVSGPLARLANLVTAGDIPRLSFAMSFVFGVAGGAFVYALAARGFHIVHVRGEGVPRIVGGAALMGIGATFAGGCNIGQGLSGVSTLSLESLLTVTGILLGITLVVKWMERR